jgi:hypothetical protein
MWRYYNIVNLIERYKMNFHSKIFGQVKRDCCFGWSDTMILRYLILSFISDKSVLEPLIRAQKSK